MAMSSARRSLLLVTLGFLASCESPTKPLVPVGSVVVGPGTALVDPGATVQFSVIVNDESGNPLEGRAVTWSVVDTTVASITSTGLLTAKPHPGATNRTSFVRADVGGKFGVSTLNVRPAVVTSITIAPFTAVLQPGDTPTLTVQVRDAFGTLLPGRPPTWTSRDQTTARIAADGSLSPVGFLAAGNRTVRIVANIGAVADSITVTVAPTTVVGLRVFPEAPYIQPNWTKTLRVEGRSPANTAVLGITPTFTSSNPTVATVNAAGTVTALAGAAGTTNIIATFGAFADTATVTVDACGAAPAGAYPLVVRFYGPNPPSGPVQEAFDCAANRIRAIIRSPLGAIAFNNTSLQNCVGEPITITETNSGLIIYAKVDSIDGPGQVLGSAGPCFVNSATRIPVVGVMRFDQADLNALSADGRLGAVIMHEMLHVVGIGTMWRDAQLNPQMWTGAVGDPGFLGQRAREACVDFHGGANICATQVPIEDCVGITGCGAGTLHGHWRELIFRRELMTGYVSQAGLQNPFSRMTIQALGDLGYAVDPDQSNDYVIPSPALMGLMELGTRSGELQMPAPRLPTHYVDPMGRLRPIIR